MKTKYKIVMSDGKFEEVEGTLFQSMLVPKNSFGIRKQGKDWVVDHIQSGRSCGVHAKTEKDALKEINKIIVDKEKLDIIKNSPSVLESIDAMKHFRELENEWISITGKSLPISCLYGLDILELDKQMNPPDGTSLKQHIINTFGERAGEIISEMLNCEPAKYGMSYALISRWIKEKW